MPDVMDMDLAARAAMPAAPEAGFQEALQAFLSAAREGDAARAAELELELLRTGNNFPPLFAVLGKGWMTLRFEHTERAVARLEAFCALHADLRDRQLLFNLATLQGELGRREAAMRTYRDMRELVRQQRRAGTANDVEAAAADTILGVALVHLGAADATAVGEARDVLRRVVQSPAAAESVELRRVAQETLRAADALSGSPHGGDGAEELALPPPPAWDDREVPCDRESLRRAVAEALSRSSPRPLRLRRGCGADALEAMGWGAAQKWTVDALREKAGGESVYVMERTEGAPEGSALSLFGYAPQRRLRKFGDFLRDAAAAPGGMYLATQGLKRSVFQPPLAGTALQEDVPLPAIVEGWPVRTVGIWLGVAAGGRAGSASRLHHDAFDNINCVARGRKVFRVFAPEAGVPTFGKRVGISAGRHRYLHDILGDAQKAGTARQLILGEHFSWIDARVGAAAEMAAAIELDAGECIVLPRGFFHQVESFGCAACAANNGTEALHVAINAWFDAE